MRRSLAFALLLSGAGLLLNAHNTHAQGWAPKGGPVSRTDMEREIKSLVAKYGSSGVTEAAMRRFVETTLKKQSRITAAELRAAMLARVEEITTAQQKLNDRVTALEQRSGQGSAASFDEARRAIANGDLESFNKLMAASNAYEAERYAKDEWARFMASFAKDTSQDKADSIAYLQTYVSFTPQPGNFAEAQELLTRLIREREDRIARAKASTPWLAGHESATLGRTSGLFTSLAFSPSGDLLAAGGDDGNVDLYRWPGSKTVRRIPAHNGAVRAVSFSPDGVRMVTAGSDGLVIVWNLATGKSLHVLKGHREAVNSAMFTRDGKWIVTASSDERVLIWNAATGALERTLLDESACRRSRREDPPMRSNGCNGVSWNVTRLLAEPSSDGTRVLVMTRSIVEQFSFVGGQSLGRPAMEGYYFHKPVYAARYSPDGRFMFAENLIAPMGKIFDVKSNREVCQIERVEGARRARSAEFSFDGKGIAIGTEEASVEMYWTDCSHLATLTGHGGPVIAVDVSPDGRTVASIGLGKEIIVWKDKSVSATK